MRIQFNEAPDILADNPSGERDFVNVTLEIPEDNFPWNLQILYKILQSRPKLYVFYPEKYRNELVLLFGTLLPGLYPK